MYKFQEAGLPFDRLASFFVLVILDLQTSISL
nr:MAG TPA: hypothetical protein [Caudoviricetes sp.]